MNKSISLLIGVLATLLSFSSCTDHEEVDINYEQSVGITAAHIFDSFTPIDDGDFNLQKEGWTLNIETLYYNDDGELVTKESFKSNTIEEKFISSAVLLPGEYTVVAIAHFTKEDENYCYWNITNEDNINDLSIKETDNVYTTAFETLGIHTEKISVNNHPTEYNIDIKPTTALFEVYEIDKMLSYIGYKGKYSIKCLKVAQYNVRTIGYQNNVKFKDGKPSFYMSEQTSNYNFAISRPYDRMHNNEQPNSRSYRAILPENAKQFSWTLYNGEFDADWAALIKNLLGSYPTEGRSETKDIISGHQYSLAFMLDACEFIYEDITGKKYNIDDAISESFSKYQISKIDKMVNFGFEHMVGTSAKEISHAIDVEIESTGKLPSGNYIARFYHSPETVFEQYVSASFKEPACDEAWRIMLLLSLPKSAYGSDIGQEMPEKVFQEIWDALNNKYHHFRTVGKMTMFLDGPTKAESKAGIILDGTELDNVCLYFDDVNLYIEGEDGGNDNQETPNVIKEIFPYEWNSFINQNIDVATAAIGPNFSVEGEGKLIWYYDFNDMVSRVCLTNTGDQVKFVYVYVKSPDDEIDALILDYLNKKFYPTAVANKFIDSDNFMNYTMLITYENGIISYAGR